MSLWKRAKDQGRIKIDAFMGGEGTSKGKPQNPRK
jgi:hypothetical protein